MIQLGIDAGATTSKWSLSRSGTVYARGTTLPLTGHLFTVQQEHAAVSCLEELARDVARVIGPERPTRIVAGVTGLEQDQPAALTMRYLIAQAFGTPESDVAVFSDLHLAYLAHHRPGHGILLYAGTGSIAFHLREDGTVLRAGGYGYLLADEGSGLWMAREAVRHLLRKHDEGVDLPSPLSVNFQVALGDLNWPTLRTFIYGRNRDALAALAPLVTAAARSGDPAARQILHEGAEELSRLVRCLFQALPEGMAVTAAGGAFAPEMFALVQHVLAPLVDVQLSTSRISDHNALYHPQREADRESQPSSARDCLEGRP